MSEVRWPVPQQHKQPKPASRIVGVLSLAAPPVTLSHGVDAVIAEPTRLTFQPYQGKFQPPRVVERPQTFTPLPLTRTLSHTVDAVVLKTFTVGHTVDALIVKTTTLGHAVDAVVYAYPALPYKGVKQTPRVVNRPETFTPLPLQRILSHTVDALISQQTSLGHAVDAVVYAYPSLPYKGEFQAPRIVGKPRLYYPPFVVVETFTRTHTVTAVVLKTATASHTVDAVILKTASLSHTVDASVVTSATLTHTVTAVVLKTLGVSHSVDAVILKTLTASHAVDAVILKTFTVVHTVDAVVLRQATVAHAVTAVILKTLTVTHTVDAVILDTSTLAHTVDAVILKVQSATHTVDAAVWGKPANLQVTVTSPTELHLSWNPDPGTSWFEIERDGVIIATTTGTTYDDTGLTPDTEYCYRVRAVIA